MNTAELSQLRDLLEVLKAGQVDIAIEWLEAAIRIAEKRAEDFIIDGRNDEKYNL